MPELGHVVFYVRDLQRSLRFYQELLGLELSGIAFGGRAALLTGGRTHHELLLIEVGPAEGPPQGRRIGLYHVGWKIGDSLDELKHAKQRAEVMGFPIQGLADHTISRSLYLRDPDGNEVELYVDDPDYDWRNDRTWLDHPTRPLEL